MESIPVSSERKTQFLESCRHKVETPSTPEPTSFGSGAPANQFEEWTPTFTNQHEGMTPWLVADPQSELAKGNEEKPQARKEQMCTEQHMQSHWDTWPQNEEFLQAHAHVHHQDWGAQQQWAQAGAGAEWYDYHHWTPTNNNDNSQQELFEPQWWPHVQQEVVEEEVVGEVVEEVEAPRAAGSGGAPPVQKRGRGERGGKHVKWWSGLHKARKNGPLSEAAYIQQNPHPKKIKRETEEE